MPDTDPLLRLRTPADLIAILPYLVGYRLEDSLVVAAVDQGRLGLIQRFDLPGGGRGGPPRRAVDVARRMLRREDPEAVLIVAYESVPGAGDALRTAMARLCDRNGWRVLAEVVARGDRWWDLDAGDDPLGPGRPVPSARQVPAVAECVAAGLAPLPGRTALAGLFEPDEASTTIGELIAAERARRTAKPARPTERYRLDARAWRRWLAAESRGAGGPTPNLEECLASCVVSLEDTDLRDALIAWLAPGMLPPAMAPRRAWAAVAGVLGPVPPVTRSRRRRRGGTAEPGGADRPADLPDRGRLDEAPAPGAGEIAPGELAPGELAPGAFEPAELRQRGRNRLIDAVRATPADDQAPLLTVFAALAWWQGDGAVAGEAVQRARRLRPSYTLAVLLHEMIRQGIRFGSAAGLVG